MIHLLENSPHERLTHKATAISNIIPGTEIIQGMPFTLIEHDSDAFITRLLGIYRTFHFFHTYKLTATLSPELTKLRPVVCTKISFSTACVTLIVAC